MTSKPNNWKLTIEYDGRPFSGWQRQPEARTIQGELERALTMILRERISIVGAGRTDAGVHALGQVAHFRSASPFDSDWLRWRVNCVLPDEIVIRTIDSAPDDFHARYSATARTYRYRLYNRPVPSPFHRYHSWWIARDLDLTAAREAAGALVGTYDFSAFTVAKDGPMVRDVRALEIFASQEPGPDSGLVCIDITANAFLHHMVRLIVGTLAEVAAGKRRAATISEILAAGDVGAAGVRAPAKGLCLQRIEYG